MPKAPTLGVDSLSKFCPLLVTGSTGASPSLDSGMSSLMSSKRAEIAFFLLFLLLGEMRGVSLPSLREVLPAMNFEAAAALAMAS